MTNEQSKPRNNLEELVAHQNVAVAAYALSKSKVGNKTDHAQLRVASRAMSEYFVAVDGKYTHAADSLFAACENHPEVLRETIQRNFNLYLEKLKKLTVAELQQHYSEVFGQNLFKDETKKVFSQFANETFGEIEKKMSEAEYILDPRGKVGEDKKLDAKKTMEKYEGISSLIALFEGRKNEKLYSQLMDKEFPSIVEDFAKQRKKPGYRIESGEEE